MITLLTRHYLLGTRKPATASLSRYSPCRTATSNIINSPVSTTEIYIYMTLRGSRAFWPVSNLVNKSAIMTITRPSPPYRFIFLPQLQYLLGSVVVEEAQATRSSSPLGKGEAGWRDGSAARDQGMSWGPELSYELISPDEERISSQPTWNFASRKLTQMRNGHRAQLIVAAPSLWVLVPEQSK